MKKIYRTLLAIVLIVALGFTANSTVFAAEAPTSDEPEEQLYTCSFDMVDGVVQPRSVFGNLVLDYPSTSGYMNVTGTANKIGFTFMLSDPSKTGVGTIRFEKNLYKVQAYVDGSYTVPVDSKYHAGTFKGDASYITEGSWHVIVTSSVPFFYVTMAVGN